jgi:hypothetical protein
MRTTVTLDDDLAIRLQRHRTQHGESFRQALNEAVRVGLSKLEERADAAPEVSQTRPLLLGRRLAGSMDNAGEPQAPRRCGDPQAGHGFLREGDPVNVYPFIEAEKAVAVTSSGRASC